MHYVSLLFSSRRRHTRFDCDWSSDVCSSDLGTEAQGLSVMPHPSVAIVGIQKPAKTVFCRTAIRLSELTLRESNRSQGGLHLGRAQQSVLPQGGIPLV